MALTGSDGPSHTTILREVSTVLRAAEDPNALTFKQVRLAVEKSLGLPEGSLHKSRKAVIKEAVHSVMDALDREAAAQEEEDEEEEEGEFEGVRPADTAAATAAAAAAASAAPSGRREGESSSAKSAKKRGTVGTGTEGAGGAVAPTAKRGSKTKSRGRPKGGEKEDAKAAGNSNKRKNAAGSGGGGGDEEEEDDGLVCVLSETAVGRRQVNVGTWKGNAQVNIREYYRKEATFAPSKKGITLNPAQFEVLGRNINHVDEAIGRLTRT